MHYKNIKYLRAVCSPDNLRKSFWAIMALSHTPAVVGAWKSCLAGNFSVDQVGGWILLLLSMVFFGLKVKGVRWLQFKADRRSCLAFTLVVGLVHLDCIQPDLQQKIPFETTIVLSVSLLVFSAPRLSRTLSDLLRQNRIHKTLRSLLPTSTNTAWVDMFHPRCWILNNRNVISRAPPA